MLSNWSVFKESFALSVQQLIANKLRSSLSLLGVTIGIFSIITILTAIDALKNDISGSINKLGDNIIFVGKWPWMFSDSDYPWWDYFKRPNASYDDYRKLSKRMTKAEFLSFTVNPSNSHPMFRGESIENASVEGATQDYADVFDFNIEEGRFFSSSESNLGVAVAVIGGGLAEEMKKISPQLLGKSIEVFGRKVKIIGIIKKEGQGGLLGMNNDQQIMIPYLFADKVTYLDPKDSDPQIQVKAKAGVTLDQLMFEIQQHMRSIRKLRPTQKDDFAMNQLSIIANGFNGIFSMLNIIGWVIGFFALIVGGFGIANIMYVSVTERTNIIGVKKALGAKRNYILMEFLIESILLCLFGGFLGLAVIVLITGPLSTATGMTFALSLKNATIGIVVSMLIGLISGYLPAKKAANLDPVEAIRAK